MGVLQSLVTPLHTRTARDYLGRMQDDKVACMRKAKEYNFDYWDGERRYGYGGYCYDGRWKGVAERLIQLYDLKPGAKILDIGCGKAFLLYELARLLPGSETIGVDISAYGLKEAKPEIIDQLILHRAQDPFPWEDQRFDLVISLNVLHNLQVFDLKRALSEMNRVGKHKYLCVESFRNEQELFNLQCWALTCESFFAPESWIWLFEEFGYSGDYEFIYFE